MPFLHFFQYFSTYAMLTLDCFLYTLMPPIDTPRFLRRLRLLPLMPPLFLSPLFADFR